MIIPGSGKKKWTQACAGCGMAMQLTRGPHGVSPRVVFRGPEAWHPGCLSLADAPPSRARETIFKVRLSEAERATWDGLLAVRGDETLAAMLRALVTAELAREKASPPTVAPERCRAVATTYGSLLVDPADARLPCACGTRERCYACGVPHVLVRLCRSCAARGITTPRSSV
ncbi:MAG: hypothetical protein KF782_34795 [Labilithrix sp.]|nr:hypothetical protein [Labilithrix sp.]